jgi:hypothetical protein
MKVLSPTKCLSQLGRSEPSPISLGSTGAESHVTKPGLWGTVPGPT